MKTKLTDDKQMTSLSHVIYQVTASDLTHGDHLTGFFFLFLFFLHPKRHKIQHATKIIRQIKTMNTIHPEAMVTESDVVDVTPEFDA